MFTIKETIIEHNLSMYSFMIVHIKTLTSKGEKKEKNKNSKFVAELCSFYLQDAKSDSKEFSTK